MGTRIRTTNCLGDSSVYGYGDRETHLGWAGRLRQDFHKMNEVEGVELGALPAFYNLGVLGNTAIKLLRANEARYGSAVLNILSVGAQDSAERANGTKIVSELNFERRMREIGKKFTDNETAMLYVGLPSFDNDRARQFRGFDITYSTERVSRYETIALNVFHDMDIPTVPLFEATNTEAYLTTMLDKDGLHPNTDGYQFIYETVRPTVHELWGAQ